MNILAFALLLAFIQTPLTNKDVIDLVKAGLGAEAVATKVRASKTDFDTSPEALKELKREGVPDAVILAMLQPGQKPESETLLVPEGTSFDAALLDEVSSETASEGDPVTLKATEDVKIGGRVVIRAGAIVKGVVEEAQARGNAGRAGMVRITLKTVTAVDGQKIKVSASRSSAGTDKTNRAMKTTAEHNPFSGIVRGGRAKLKEGLRVTVYTEEDKNIRP